MIEIVKTGIVEAFVGELEELLEGLPQDEREGVGRHGLRWNAVAWASLLEALEDLRARAAGAGPAHSVRPGDVILVPASWTDDEVEGFRVRVQHAIRGRVVVQRARPHDRIEVVGRAVGADLGALEGRLGVLYGLAVDFADVFLSVEGETRDVYERRLLEFAADAAGRLEAVDRREVPRGRP